MPPLVFSERGGKIVTIDTSRAFYVEMLELTYRINTKCADNILIFVDNSDWILQTFSCTSSRNSRHGVSEFIYT